MRASGLPPERLARWLDGMETACLTAMRHLDYIETWSARTEAEMSSLSGKTPPALRAVLTEWPLLSAPMAEALTAKKAEILEANQLDLEAAEANGISGAMLDRLRLEIGL